MSNERSASRDGLLDTAVMPARHLLRGDLEAAWWSALRLLRGPIDPNSLTNWNPELVETLLGPHLALFRTYFRAEIHGVENIPDGAALITGIHGGGMMTPDTVLTFLAFYEHTKVSRPLYAMGHRMLFYIPGFNALAAGVGAVEGTRENAVRVLEAGHPFLVYPGGEEDMARPYAKRHRVNFAGRTGFVKIALETGAPILPVGSIGGHEGWIVLTDGRGIASRLGLKRLLKVNQMPISLSVPWGLTVGYMPYVPLPAKLAISFGKPMHFTPSAQEKTDPAYHAYVRDEVEAEVQRLVDDLAVRCLGKAETR